MSAEAMQRLLKQLLRRLWLATCALPLVAQAALPENASVPGGVAVIPLASASAAKPEAWLGEQQVLVTAEHGQWLAVVGLSLDTAPGTQQLKVNVNGTSKLLPFTVNPKQYPEQHITLKDKSKVELSAKDLARAEREIAVIKDLKRHWRTTASNDFDFIAPAKGRLASRFGLRRFFNGEARLPHAGLDVAVHRGTPVHAVAGGVVLNTDDYFFNGNTVFLDHGNGLITMYCHMDRITVKQGQVIKKGQKLGLSGMTGRATGPHLHWSVILNGAMVDPAWFVTAALAGH